MIPRFLWNILKTKKIKIKEVREYNINKDGDLFVVNAFGFFGGGVPLYEGTHEECIGFIENLTTVPEKEEI